MTLSSVLVVASSLRLRRFRPLTPPNDPLYNALLTR
jgi:hypothetical protein